MIEILLSVGAFCAAVCAYYGIAAINAMGPATRLWIRYGFIGKTSGYAAIVLADIDYLHGQALAWPWLLLIGLIFAAGGTAVIYLANHRACYCPLCPGRRRKAPDFLHRMKGSS